MRKLGVFASVLNIKNAAFWSFLQEAAALKPAIVNAMYAAEQDEARGIAEADRGEGAGIIAEVRESLVRAVPELDAQREHLRSARRVGAICKQYGRSTHVMQYGLSAKMDAALFWWWMVGHARRIVGKASFSQKSDYGRLPLGSCEASMLDTLGVLWGELGSLRS